MYFRYPCHTNRKAFPSNSKSLLFFSNIHSFIQTRAVKLPDQRRHVLATLMPGLTKGKSHTTSRDTTSLTPLIQTKQLEEPSFNGLNPRKKNPVAFWGIQKVKAFIQNTLLCLPNYPLTFATPLEIFQTGNIRGPNSALVSKPKQDQPGIVNQSDKTPSARLQKNGFSYKMTYGIFGIKSVPKTVARRVWQRKYLSRKVVYSPYGAEFKQRWASAQSTFEFLP